MKVCKPAQFDTLSYLVVAYNSIMYLQGQHIRILKIIAKTERPSEISAVLFDDAAIVYIVLPLQSKNLQDHADKDIVSFFRALLTHGQIRLLDLPCTELFGCIGEFNVVE